MVKEQVDKTNKIDKNSNRGNEINFFKNRTFKAKGGSKKGNLLKFHCKIFGLPKILFKKMNCRLVLTTNT
jgi:hypothetical protein